MISNCRITEFVSLIHTGLLFCPVDLVNITAETGQNVNLSCRANNNNLVTFLEWSKNGLRKGYLLLYRDERFDLENQHPSFKNRVELQDRQMKDGDVSLILKNVTLDDRGIYECRVETKINRRKRANQDDDPVIVISLNVVPPGEVKLCCMFVFVLLLFFVCFLTCTAVVNTLCISICTLSFCHISPHFLFFLPVLP
uniref:Ig-like domain-containing protein n=1 Tax=Oreochromis aureus TaxID=47969 RepID=A0AAZ1XIW6_OREAU